MTLPVTAAATDRSTRPAWVTATLGAVSVLAHVWVLTAHTHGATLTVLMVSMTLWCAWCAVEAVARPTAHCLQRLLVMSLAMMFVHAAMIIGLPRSSGGHAHHTPEVAPSSAAITAASGHASAMLVLIGVEYLVALACVFSLRRRRSLTPSPYRPPLKETSVGVAQSQGMA